MHRPPRQRLLTQLPPPDWKLPVPLTWHNLGVYLLVTVGVMILLALRQPSSLLNAEFVFEDGATFFSQAYNLTALESLTQIYAGYWHVIPRIVAETGMWLPTRLVPLYYSLAALCLTAAAISWFILPLHRSIVSNAWIRLVVVVLIALTPRVDGLMLIAYVQWFLAIWAILVALAPPPKQQWVRWAMAVAYTLVAFSVPALVMLIPLWLLRWWSANDASQRWWSGLLAAVTLAATLLVMSIPRPSIMSEGNLWIAVQDTLHGLTYRGFTLPLLGIPASDTLILRAGWWTSYLVATSFIVLLAYGFLTDRRPGKRALGLFLAYLAFATAALYLIRAELFGFPYATTAERLPLGGGRYFFVSATMTLIGAAIQVEHLIATRPQLSKAATAVGLMVALSYLGAFRIGSWPDADWSSWSALVSHLNDARMESPQRSIPPVATTAPTVLTTLDQVNLRYPVGTHQISNIPRPPHASDTYVVRVPIAPAGWFATLYVPNNWHGVADFPEGLRLLDYSIERAGGNVAVDLFWLGETQPDPAADSFYTAYVHLLDTTGERVAGFDVLLERNEHNSLPEDVLRSHHVLQPPPGNVNGPFSLAVGLYQLTDAGLIPGTSITLSETVDWPAAGPSGQ